MPNSFMVIREGLATAQVCTNINDIEKVIERFKEWEHEEMPDHRRSLNWQKAGPELCAGDPNPIACYDHPETHKHWLLVC